MATGNGTYSVRSKFALNGAYVKPYVIQYPAEKFVSIVVHKTYIEIRASINGRQVSRPRVINLNLFVYFFYRKRLLKKIEDYIVTKDLKRDGISYCITRLDVV